jgi:hypothetical protein
MSGISCVGRHGFFDSVEVWRHNELTAIAASSVPSTPMVALGRLRPDFLYRHVVKKIYAQSMRQLLCANRSIANNNCLAADSNLLEDSLSDRQRNVNATRAAHPDTLEVYNPRGSLS